MTSSSKRKSKYDTTFGASVSSALAGARMTQLDLANATKTTVGYTNQIITGHKPATQSWIDIVAEHLNLPIEKKQELLELANERRKRSKLVLPKHRS
jgi:Ethanolamine utilization protein EutJ (predicted chaperonin)